MSVVCLYLTPSLHAGAAFEDPLFAVPAPASPETGGAFLPPHEIVRAKLEQSAPVAGCAHLGRRHSREGPAGGVTDTFQNVCPG